MKKKTQLKYSTDLNFPSPAEKLFHQSDSVATANSSHQAGSVGDATSRGCAASCRPLQSVNSSAACESGSSRGPSITCQTMAVSPMLPGHQSPHPHPHPSSASRLLSAQLEPSFHIPPFCPISRDMTSASSRTRSPSPKFQTWRPRLRVQV